VSGMSNARPVVTLVFDEDRLVRSVDIPSWRRGEGDVSLLRAAILGQLLGGESGAPAVPPSIDLQDVAAVSRLAQPFLVDRVLREDWAALR
jgi:hypothetical protein